MVIKRKGAVAAVSSPSHTGLLAKQKRVVAPNQKRECKNKSRTGCMTCKTRRVKCDERRPFCLRCERAEFDCEGYALPVKVVHAEAIWQLGKGPRRLTAPNASPAWAPLDETEVGYFDLFRHQLIHDLAGYNQQDFWGRIVLCEGARDECVQQSIVALGALSQALFFVPQPSDTAPSVTRPLSTQSLLNSHHKAAIRYHTRAIELFRDRIAAKRPAPSARSIMIMTLLLVTFEFLQGNMKAADHLMAGGIQLLKDNLTILQGAAGRPRSKKLTSDEFEDVEHMLPRLSVSSSVTHFCNLQSRQFAELRGSGVGSLPDADGRTGLPRLLALWSEFSTRALVFVCQSFRNQLLQLKYDVTEVEERQTQLLLRLRQWRALLDQYLVGAKSETVRYSLKMLIPHWLMVYIFTSCVLDPTDLSYDHFEPEFREINTRCAELLAMEIYQEGSATAQSFKNKIKFSLGDGLITPLALVIGKCRIHDVRMEAAEMFRLLPREAAWDAQALIIGKLGLVLMEERARVIHGYVPSNSRWFWTGGEWDIDNRVLHSRYVRIVPAEDGSPIHLGMTLDLDSLPDICGEVGCTKDHSYLPLRHARSGLRDVMH